MKKRSSRLIIPMPDYERIFKTIHGILLTEKTDDSKSCLYFGIFGATILNHYYKLNAKVKMGCFFFKPFLESNNVLAFAKMENGHLISSYDAFHCWIEVGDYIIDFTAPLYRKLLAEYEMPSVIERKMFQKPISDTSPSPNEVSNAGSFFLASNSILESQLMNEFFMKQTNKDLMEICLDWFKPYPKKMDVVVHIGDGKGDINTAKLSPFSITGAW